MNLLFLGYFKKPFDFCYVTDKMLVDSMKKIRKDEITFCDWNDVKDNLDFKNGFNSKIEKYCDKNIKEFDSSIIVEVPTPSSTHVKYDKVWPIINKMASEKIRGVNPAETYVKFPDKKYYTQYSLPFPKTKIVKSSNLEEALTEFNEEVVVKPIDGDGGYCVAKLKNKYDEVNEFLKKSNLSDKTFLIQEYLPEIKDGERSLFFFNKQFKYAMLKKPRAGEFKSNEDCVESLTRYHPNSDEIKIAKNAIRTINSPSFVERVDITSKGRIMEMTLDCPGLYLVEADIDRKIGKWFYEAIDASIKS
ncbi:MAG: hypothetical protein WC781_04800 [Candidatus Pacearchaeota archaeon]|jgi:glutathione synthase/RimK-type ligase-like ATP-grasp enzyme